MTDMYLFLRSDIAAKAMVTLFSHIEKFILFTVIE